MVVVDSVHSLLQSVLTIFICSVVFASASASVPTQPHQNELAWSIEACEEAHLDAEQVSRMTGGCAEMTFCNRGSSYSSGIYGYRAASSGGTNSSSGECLSPGPVMRMTPGKTYGLILCSEGDESFDRHPGANIHVHGLHISGSGNSDDSSRLIFPNSCGFYEYAIPNHHMGGTSWYHPHVRGHTLEQAKGGAFGLLVIQDRPRDLTVDPSVGSETERDAVYDFLTDLDRELLILAAFSGGKWINSNQDMNGTMEYNIDVDIWYRLRILTFNPVAAPETVIFPPECDAYALAYDGVYIFNPPRARLETYKMTGASRLDVALKCTAAGTFEITSTDGWSEPSIPIPTDSDIALDGQGWEGLPSISTLVVSDVGSSKNTTSNITGPFLGDGLAWKSYRPNYLRDLRNVAVDNTWSIDMVQDGKLNGFPYNSECPLKDTNGQNFEFESVQEWIHTSVQTHPAHVHVYHQQVISGCGEGHDVGEYYDTISDGGNGVAFQDNCTVRLQMLGVGGRVTLHCHNLYHERRMGWIHVENGPTTNTEPCCISGFCSPCVNETNIPDQCEESSVSDEDDDDDGDILVVDCNCTMCGCSEKDTSGSSINKSILQTQICLLIILVSAI